MFLPSVAKLHSNLGFSNRDVLYTFSSLTLKLVSGIYSPASFSWWTHHSFHAKYEGLRIWCLSCVFNFHLSPESEIFLRCISSSLKGVSLTIIAQMPLELEHIGSPLSLPPWIPCLPSMSFSDPQPFQISAFPTRQEIAWRFRWYVRETFVCSGYPNPAVFRP